MKYCIVKNCPSVQKKNDLNSKSMFKFPTNNPELLEIWKKQINRDFSKHKITDNTSICEEHFEEKFIKIFQVETGKLRKNLTVDAYPTIFKEYPEKIRRKKNSKKDEFHLTRLEISNHSNNCRFCLKSFPSDSNKIKITDQIAKRFRSVTQLELRTSNVYSKSICQVCDLNLKDFSSFKTEMITKQQKLYRVFENLEEKDTSRRSFAESKEELESEDEERDSVKSEENFDDFESVQIKQEDESLSEDENMHNFSDFCGDPVVIVEPFQAAVEPAQNTIKTEDFSIFDLPTWNNDNSDDDGIPDDSYFDTEFEMKLKNSSIKREIQKEKKPKPIIKIEETDGITEEGSKKKIVKKALCQECGKSFSPENFRRHYERVHLKVKRYTCDFCGYKCYLRYNMIDHLKTHTGEKSIRCAECPKCFSTDQGLRAHKKNCHSDKRPFACDCGKAFKTKCSLVIHTRYNHTKEKPFGCDLCEKTFYTKYKLKNHRITHSDNPQVPCDVCGKTFFTRSQLGRHQLTHMEPRFQCTLCGKKFIKKSNYTTHLKTHTGQRDYACPYCEMKYFKNAHLNRHILNLHMKLKVKCEVPGCSSQFARKETYRNHVLSHHKTLDPEHIRIVLDRIKEIKLEVDTTEANQYQLNILSQPMY